MQVICLEDAAFYALINEVVDRLKSEQNIKEDKWINTEEAMAKLRIRSKTTLQRLRDEGRISFTQPKAKVILYDTDSIEAYLNKHTKEAYRK